MKRMLCALLALLITVFGACAEEKELVIELEGNPTTGFEWTGRIVAGDCVEEVGMSYTSDQADPEACGVGGIYRYALRPVSAGTAIVLLDYARSWEREPMTTNVYLIRVQEDLEATCEQVPEEACVLHVTAGEILEAEHSAVVVTADGETLIAAFAENDALPVVGEQLILYTDGTMTLSEPAGVVVLGWETVPGEEAR